MKLKENNMKDTEPKLKCKPGSIPTLTELVNVFSDEVRQLRDENYRLSNRIRKFEVIFENAFRQEAEERLSITEKKNSGGYAECAVSELDQLRFKLNNQ
jgi:hypothetical protein